MNIESRRRQWAENLNYARQYQTVNDPFYQLPPKERLDKIKQMHREYDLIMAQVEERIEAGVPEEQHSADWAVEIYEELAKALTISYHLQRQEYGPADEMEHLVHEKAYDLFLEVPGFGHQVYHEAIAMKKMVKKGQVDYSFEDTLIEDAVEIVKEDYQWSKEEIEKNPELYIRMAKTDGNPFYLARIIDHHSQEDGQLFEKELQSFYDFLSNPEVFTPDKPELIFQTANTMAAFGLDPKNKILPKALQQLNLERRRSGKEELTMDKAKKELGELSVGPALEKN